MPSARPLDTMFERIETANAAHPPAAMFGLAAAGHDSLYEQLVSCVLSIRTYDETSYPASVALFERARTPEAMLALDHEELVGLVAKCTYPGQKADTILALSRRIVDEHGGETPADFDALTAFKGVGPKCANLALGVALGVPAISVDVHVHRVVNRWGLVATREPKATLAALREGGAARALGRRQPAADALRQAHVHGRAAEVFRLPGAAVVRLRVRRTGRLGR